MAVGETELLFRRQDVAPGSSGAATNAASALVVKQLLFRAWVWWTALADLGPTFADAVREGPLRYGR